jgi:hypothetical protein
LKYLHGGFKKVSIIENIPIAGQAMKFARLAKQVHNCSDPVQASITATKAIVVDCMPPQVNPLKCIALGAQIAIAVSGGAPIGIALSITLGNQIMEEKL